MVLLKENFVLLTAIFNNILFVNIPDGVKKMAICFTCENRSDFQIMRHANINAGHLPVFYYNDLPSTNYKLKLIFQDGFERDTEWLQGDNSTTTFVSEPVIENINLEIKNIFILLSLVLLSISVLLLKIFMKCIEKRIKRLI